MGIIYGKKPKLLDRFNSIDLSKWGTFGLSFGTIESVNGSCVISNTTGTNNDYIGIYSLESFPIGASITVKSRSVSGRHNSLIGFGSSPYHPYPHAGTAPGCTWYSRADDSTSTISWYNENATTGFYDGATENLTTFQILKMIRVSSSEVQFYRNNILEYTATGLILANDYPIYFSCDGWTKPNSAIIDFVSVV